MKSFPIQVGEKVKKYMPYSEVCMHMRVSGKVMVAEMISERMVQLYKLDGEPFSFPISTGEAGIFTPPEGSYYYPDDSKRVDCPSIEDVEKA